MSITTKQLEAALAEIPQRQKEMLLEYLSFAQQRLGLTATQDYMRDAGKNAGPRQPSDTGPLRIVSTRLSRSLVGGQFNQSAGSGGPEGISKIEVDKDGVKLTYGSKVPYAAAHEYGFQGTVQVPAHTRTITQAFGKSIKPRDVTVKAHSRQMNIPARPYLQPSLEDNMELLQNELADRFAEMVMEVIE